ncbi:hypothetical protein MSSAC_1012 [Methanosarcina siciliae C2J]|uniref:Uncharacterized protein n=1 Tax=Methanosarcina siciliae C2J TaxID=1434118 RepID=A0A0E3PKC8_9EURY|nr:hypothetical protein [Methanosarcina siciliae]AKB35602.1 hypothetical protein MSSAC_1012 [Methanosarcina siciliae C2J]
MRLNNIIKFNLETRTKELRDQGKTLDEISEILSVESKLKITKSTVFRYFEAKDREAVQVIEKQDKLKARVVEAEISTIEKRIDIIDKFLDIAKDAKDHKDYRSAVQALKGATEAQDSLDARIGKLKGKESGTNVNIFNIQEAMNGAREQLSSRISGIAAKFEEVRDPEQPN